MTAASPSYLIYQCVVRQEAACTGAASVKGGMPPVVGSRQSRSEIDGDAAWCYAHALGRPSPRTRSLRRHSRWADSPASREKGRWQADPAEEPACVLLRWQRCDHILYARIECFFSVWRGQEPILPFDRKGALPTDASSARGINEVRALLEAFLAERSARGRALKDFVVHREECLEEGACN